MFAQTLCQPQQQQQQQQPAEQQIKATATH